MNPADPSSATLKDQSEKVTSLPSSNPSGKPADCDNKVITLVMLQMFFLMKFFLLVRYFKLISKIAAITKLKRLSFLNTLYSYRISAHVSCCRKYWKQIFWTEVANIYGVQIWEWLKHNVTFQFLCNNNKLPLLPQPKMYLICWLLLFKKRVPMMNSCTTHTTVMLDGESIRLYWGFSSI